MHREKFSQIYCRLELCKEIVKCWVALVLVLNFYKYVDLRVMNTVTFR